MSKIIAYLRVSSDGQAEKGYGLDVQRERVVAYALSQGMTIDEFVVDDGVSGTTLDRPGLNRLVEMCRNDEVGLVIVYKLDRLSRSLRNLLNVFNDVFGRNDVFLTSVSEQFSTSTPQGRLFFNIIGSFAEYDHDVIVERLAKGREARASSGERPSGRVPYGYRVVDGRTVVDAAKASVVKRIFSLRSAGHAQQAIADELNAAGVAPPRSGQRWTQARISEILRNPIYSGKKRYETGGAPIIVENANFALI